MIRPELPKYDRPPAVETLMGVHFARLAGWNIFHFGKLSAEFSSDYPKASLLPPILDPRDLAQGAFVSQEIPIRAIYTNVEDSELVQVQSSMFLRNWKRTAITQQYTHYATLKPKFQEDWRRFLAFLQRDGLKSPQLFQCEVTYVNNLLRGREWDTYNDLAKLLKPIAPRLPISSSGRAYDFLPEASAISLNAGYQLTESGVSLQISIQSAISSDGSEIIQLSVTAKLAPHSNTETGIAEALDSCHDAVILGFDDVITETAQKLWGKHDPR